jgi:hypothetical protein
MKHTSCLTNSNLDRKIVSALCLLFFFPLFTFGQSEKAVVPEYTAVKLYAMPVHYKTRKPVTVKELKRNFVLFTKVQDTGLCYQLMARMHSLEQIDPIPYDNVRIVCEVRGTNKIHATIVIHMGRVISIGDNYYNPDEELLKLIFDWLPGSFF